MRMPVRIRRQLAPWSASLLLALMALLVACGGSSSATTTPTATTAATATIAASATIPATSQPTATNKARPNPTATATRRPAPTATPRPKPTPTATPKPPTPTPTPTTMVVTIKGFAFSPTLLTIKAGTTVEWINKDATMHTTTSDSGDPASWDSMPLAQNATFSFTFTKPGTYTYHCNIHPFMTATIIVTS